MKQLKKILALSAALLMAGTDVFAADLPVFGDIYLAQTSKMEAKAKLLARGCGLQDVPVTYPNGLMSRELQVTPACLGFPESYQVKLFPDAGGRIGGALVIFRKTFESKDFKMLDVALQEKYGAPEARQVPFVGDRYARWNRGGLVIELSEPHMATVGTLAYIKADLWKRLQSEQKSEDEANRQKLKNAL